jgi:hypothetical protein
MVGTANVMQLELLGTVPQNSFNYSQSFCYVFPFRLLPLFLLHDAHFLLPRVLASGMFVHCPNPANQATACNTVDAIPAVLAVDAVDTSIAPLATVTPDAGVAVVEVGTVDAL